jgi:hypothetical protein
MHAIEGDHEDIVKWILALGKTSGIPGWIDIGERDGRSPLYVCTVSDYSAHFIKYINILIDAGANTKAIKYCRSSDKANLQLIKRGLVKEEKDIADVLKVRESKNIIAVLRALVRSGWDINQKFYFDCYSRVRENVLAYAVRQEWSAPSITWLIEHGAN